MKKIFSVMAAFVLGAFVMTSCSSSSLLPRLHPTEASNLVCQRLSVLLAPVMRLLTELLMKKEMF